MWIVSAAAGTAAPTIAAATIVAAAIVLIILMNAKCRVGLFQRPRELLGMLLVALEYLETGFQQAFQLGVLRRGDQRALQRAVHGLVIGNLVLRVSLIE